MVTRKNLSAYKSEDAFQIACVQFCNLAIKRPDRFWFCPNGGNLSQAQRGKFKAMGLTPGASDLHFAWSFGGVRQFPGFGTIELKWGDNEETADQERFGADMVALGHSYACVHAREGVERVESILREWRLTLHATLSASGGTLTRNAMIFGKVRR